MIIGVSVVERLAMVALLFVSRRGEVVIVEVVDFVVVVVNVDVVVVVDVDGVKRLGSKHTESLKHLVLVPHKSTGRAGVFISATV